MQIWDPTKLREALELALERGEQSFKLPSARDAMRFRSALYHYRRKNDGFANQLVIEQRDDEVTLRVEDAPEIKPIETPPAESAA